MADLEAQPTASKPRQNLSRVHPEPPKETPQLIPEVTPVATAKSKFSYTSEGDFDGIKLCLPTASATILATLVSSIFSFLGLLSFTFSEVGFFGQKTLWSTLVLRLCGWLFLVYLPVMGVSQPMLRNFILWGLEPHQSLAAAWPEPAEHWSTWLRRALTVPLLQHSLALCLMSGLTAISFERGHLGLLPWFLSVCATNLPAAMLIGILLGPPMTSRSYGLAMMFLAAPMPLLGAVATMSLYLPLRRLGGTWMGLLMPIFLSIYELVGTLLITRRFTEKFVTEMELRQAYSSTNQGIAVSVCICNLHAMAEGARLTLLYVDNQENNDFSALVPIISGIVWNCMTRIGCLDRFLYLVSRHRLKPNNSGTLLREAGYCMGYPRFGAVLALILTRLCIGTAWHWDSPEVLLLVMVFLAEVVEDILSYILWRLGVNVSPEKRFATEEQVEVGVQRRLSRRLSHGSLLSVTPTATPTATATPELDAAKAANATNTSPSPTQSRVDSLLTQLPQEDQWQERWKVRMAHDFKHGPKEFDRLPWWAHLMPVAMAQFHTIFSMTVVSNGLVFVVGLCEPAGREIGLFWWPVTEVCA